MLVGVHGERKTDIPVESAHLAALRWAAANFSRVQCGEVLVEVILDTRRLDYIVSLDYSLVKAALTVQLVRLLGTDEHPYEGD